MGKLTLAVAPTFKAKVAIPVAGGESADVEMVFKHRTKSALDAFVAARPGKTDVDSFLEMVEGWDLADEFGPTNVAILLENYIGAGLATYRTYIEQLVQTKVKN